MRPYATFDTKIGRPTSSPDVADLIRDGRPSRGGRSEIARTRRSRRSTRRLLNKATRRAVKTALRDEVSRG